jgi:hypothetical protein
MAKKTSKEIMNEYIEVDGKISSNNPTSLEQIWGYDGLSKYGTMNEDEYLARINDMMTVDLQNHARDVGLRPDVEPRILKDRLLTEFRRHIGQFRSVASKKLVKPKPIPSKIQRILKEGM